MATSLISTKKVPLPTPTRILIVGYGQSNMDQFFQASSGSPPAAVANTFFYDASQTPAVITSVPAADGIRILQNTVTTITGLPTLSINAAVGGSSLNGLASGGPNTNQTGYQGLINQVLANILPTDQVFFIWDQGETDSAGTPELPHSYAQALYTLHQNLCAAIGRTVTTAPMICAGKGVVSCSGCVVSGVNNDFFNANATAFRWNVLTNSLKLMPSIDPGAYWWNQYDHTLGPDGLHYIAAGGTALGAVKHARYITNFMGFTSGPPVFEIASAAVIDATDTSVNLTHSLGTDFTPTASTTGTNGFEVSGDNGVTWGTAATTRVTASQIKLAHASLSTTNARLVRHLYGSIPPDVTYPVSGATAVPPSKLTYDNSSLAVPLSPTTWHVRASGLTTLPMPTWRDISVLNGNGGQNQGANNIQLGSEQVRKFLVLAVAGSPVSLLSMTVTPQDFFGNPVGIPIDITNPVPLVTAGTGSPSVSIYGVTLNANNANATTFSLNLNYNGTPFEGTVVQAWTVPLADLSSTTPTGTQGTSTPTSTTGSASLAASAGGFVIVAATSTGTMTQNTSYAFSGSDALAATIPMNLRWLNPSGIQTMAGDGANIANAGIASLGVTFPSSGTVNLAAVAFR